MDTVANHPEYDKRIDDWTMLRDSAEGESKIKAESVKYLPPTPGQVLDGMSLTGKPVDTRCQGFASYNNYIQRAVYPDFFKEGIKTLIGILNEKPAKIKVPAELEYILADATYSHESIHTLLRSVHEEVLTTGRAGLFADMPEFPDPANPQFYLAMYRAEKIRNWDDGSFNGGQNKLNLVVLDETGYKRKEDFSWELTDKYRVLSLGQVSENAPLGAYRFGVTETADLSSVDWRTATYKGQPSSEIPFAFVGPNDLTPTPDDAPLIGLARICLTIYRGEADYRYTLFMQGQETLVVVGGMNRVATEGDTGELDTAVRVGADASINVEMGGDAKYIGIGSSGLPEQRMALETDRSLAAVRTGQLLAPGKMSMESGEALKTRVAAQTSTLTSIAVSTAAGLQSVLKKLAVWKGANPDEVEVTPNLDFTNYEIAAQDLVQMATAKKLGFPLSMRSLHATAKARGVTNMTFEEELAAIKDDPKELVARMDAENEATGNNPQNQAGGPKKSVAGNRPQTNKPRN